MHIYIVVPFNKMPRRKVAEPEPIKDFVLKVAFGLHVAALVMIGFQQGWTTALDIPFTIVEAAVALIALVRFFLAGVRNDIVKNKNVSYNIKYCAVCLNFQGGTSSEILYLLSFVCVVFRVLVFNEQSDCLLDTCSPTIVQKYISLVGSVMIWSVAEERKPEETKTKKRAGKPDKLGRPTTPTTVIIRSPKRNTNMDSVVLDLSGTRAFGFRKRVTGKIRLV